MFNSNDFILANLAKLKNAYGEIDEEALSNLLDVFRDNLRIKFDENETFANYELCLESKNSRNEQRNIFYHFSFNNYDNNTISN